MVKVSVNDVNNVRLSSSKTALLNEQRVLERLQGMSGCPRLLQPEMENLESVALNSTVQDNGPQILFFEDFGGHVLSESGRCGNMTLAQFLALSEALASVVAALHGRGVIH